MEMTCRDKRKGNGMNGMRNGRRKGNSNGKGGTKGNGKNKAAETEND